MKLLGVDTSTEQCSVAVLHDTRIIERCQRTARDHADLVLNMVKDVLDEAALSLDQLDGIAFGRGPGGFTGVRIGVAVAQGLAFGANLPTLGVSDLAAVAQQVAGRASKIMVCMDARMNEVYWALFGVDSDTGLVVSLSPEQVSAPAVVSTDHAVEVAIGSGFCAYEGLRERFKSAQIIDDALPRASDIVRLAAAGFARGQGKPAKYAEPVYVRDSVAWKKVTDRP